MISRLARRATAITPLPGWLLVGVAYALSLAITKFRFRQWGPDARYYLAWAYRYSGLSERESSRRTYEFLSQYSWFRDFCAPNGCLPADPADGAAGLFHGFAGGLVAPRVLYPLLSMPFVRLFGPQGMLVIPLLSYTACLLLVMVLASRLIGPRWAVLAGFLVIVPVSVSRWATYAYTEALTMALCMACVVVLPLARRATRRDLVLFGVFLFLFAFTRQFHPVVVAGVGLVWLGTAITRRSLRNEWLPFVGVAVGTSLLAGFIQSFMTQSYSITEWFLRESGAGTWSGVPAAVPRVIWSIVKADGWTISVDYPLVLLLIVSGVALLYRLRSPLVQLTLGLYLGTLLLNVLNTEPSNFRYYAMVVPMLALVAAAFVAELMTGKRPLGFETDPRPGGAAVEPEPDEAPGEAPGEDVETVGALRTRVEGPARPPQREPVRGQPG